MADIDLLAKTPDASTSAGSKPSGSKPDGSTGDDSKISGQKPEPSFTIRVADTKGATLSEGDDGLARPDAPEARELVFDLNLPKGTASPSSAEMELYREITKVEHALRHLYPADDPTAESKFRPFFERLFHIAQLSLEGDVAGKYKPRVVGGRLSAELAKAEVANIGAALLEDEAPRIKNAHIRKLGLWAAVFSLPLLVGYFGLLFLPDTSQISVFLTKVGIAPGILANFMILLMGTFLGVCLSYAFRTSEFSLSDLTKTDADYLAPQTRLLITGALAVLLALVAMLNLADISIGTFKLQDISTNSLLALVVGAILGISEQKLSGTVARRTGDLFGGTNQTSTK